MIELTEPEREALKGFVHGGSRAKIRGEWVFDDRTKALHAAVEQIITNRIADPINYKELFIRLFTDVAHCEAPVGTQVDEVLEDYQHAFDTATNT